jgi:hypothetical protein
VRIHSSGAITQTFVKGKVKLSLCLTNSTLRHKDVWGSGCIDPHILDIGTSGEWSTSCPGRFTPGERDPGTLCIGGCVGPRAGLDDEDRRKILPSPVLELRPLGLPDPEGPNVISINFIKAKVKLSL